MNIDRVRWPRRSLAWLVFCAALAYSGARVDSQPAPRGGSGDGAFRLKFDSAPVDMILDDYAEKTGRTLLKAPDVPTTSLTLRSQGDLTVEEYLQAVESVLAMHGVALLPVGDKFVRVVAIKNARQESMPIQYFEAGVPGGETDTLISELIPLKYIDLAEAQKVIDPLIHPYGQIHMLERTNSMLITDTEANLTRIKEILTHVDQPIEAREEPHIIELLHAKASDVKRKLEEILAESDKEAQKPSTVQRSRRSGQPGVEKAAAGTPATLPGVIRAARAAAEPETVEELIEQVERGIIHGTVKIVADDRTNILIIITRPENMAFFEKIVSVLDVATEPDVIVRVFRLEFADATEIAKMLNDLIGAAAEETKTAPVTETTEGRSAALRELAERRAEERPAAEEGKSKVGELSKENIKILADERTNSLIIMASKSDLATLEEIIRDMDMMLSQVLVEAVILEVDLGDNIESGFDWLQRSMIAYDHAGGGGRSAIMSFAGQGGGGSLGPLETTRLTTGNAFPGSGSGGGVAGLTYYLTFFDLNLDAVLRLVATDARTKILSSPVILTADNKAATIDVSTVRYFFKGKKYAGDQAGNPIYEDDIERQKVGIALSVTPHINESRFVVMDIVQSIDNISGTQKINDQDWPIVTTRKLEASVAVRSGDTIVLGGLVQNTDVRSRSMVPILGEIPVLGIPFRSSRKERGRNEVIVFLTPYVLDTPEEIAADARRRQGAMHTGGMWARGWSASRLAEPGEGGDERPAPAERRPAPASESREEAPAALVETPAPEPEPAAADPMAGLDPETARFIRRGERRWRRAIERADERIEREWLEDARE